MLHILEAFLAELPVLDGLSTIFCHMQPPRSIPLLFFLKFFPYDIMLFPKPHTAAQHRNLLERGLKLITFICCIK